MMPSGHKIGPNCKYALQKIRSLQVITFISPLGQNRKPEGAKTSKIPLSHKKTPTSNEGMYSSTGYQQFQHYSSGYWQHKKTCRC
jgi:hypothetical protein